MPGGGVRTMGASTALDTNGKGVIKLGDASGYQPGVDLPK
jgi:hypothetical protein